MKKFLTTLLTVVLTATLAIGGTMAYLTKDAGDEKNVFSVGNIDVSLDEEVGVYGEGGEVKEVEDGAEYTKIMPGDYLKKKVTVTNNGETDAYVAVTVTVNNGNKIAAAIDDYYEKKLGEGSGTEAHIYNMYNNIFDGWGMNYYHDNEYGSDARNTITQGDTYNIDWPKYTLKVDYTETMNNYWLFSKGNWFKSDAETVHDYWTDSHQVNGNFSLGYYTKNLEEGKETYTMIYTYYLYLPAGESSTLFNGLNVPAEFDADQLAMFDGLEINVEAKAIQADNMGIAEKYAADEAYGKAKTAFAVLAGDISADSLEVNNKPATVEVEGDDKTAVVAAINAAEPGDVVMLTGNTTIDGYHDNLSIEKAIILDLNGFTLTTEGGWGGIVAKGGCSIKNGTIKHTGNTAAIKAFQVESIENVTINVTQTDEKTKGGIVVQSGDSYVGSIKNVTITGATNGIECYHSTNDPAIGTIENVKINATDNGIYLNGAGIIGKISDSEIKGGNIGINAYLANLWHISLNIENSEISGDVSGIDIWDEAAINTDSTVTLVYDEATKFVGGMKNIEVTLGDEITCTINGEER